MKTVITMVSIIAAVLCDREDHDQETDQEEEDHGVGRGRGELAHGVACP